MKPILIALTLLTQPADEAAGTEAARLADTIAAAYEAHATRAAELAMLKAQLWFRNEFNELHAIEGAGLPALNDALAPLTDPVDTARVERVEAIAAEIDFDTLLATTPGAASLVIDIMRLAGDGETRREMVERLRDLAETGGYQSEYFRTLADVFSNQDDDADGPPHPAVSADVRSHALELAGLYRERHETWWPLAAEIAEMRGREQYVRWLLVEVMARDLDPQVRQMYQDRIGELVTPIDTANTLRVLEIFETVDFNALNAASPNTAREAVGILHHSGDIDVMRQTLALIEPAALAGEFDGARYALLYDRVAENEGRPQRYGSQDICIDGRRDIYPVEDVETVDRRRAEMGLNPLAEYRIQLIEMYGEDC